MVEVCNITFLFDHGESTTNADEGGAFAVVTRLYLNAYPPFTAVNAVAGTILCSTWSAYSELVSRMVDLQVPIRDAGHVLCLTLIYLLLQSSLIMPGYLGEF